MKLHLLVFLAVLATSGCAPVTRVVLLPQQAVPEAAVEVRARKAKTLLSGPWAMAEVSSRGTIEIGETDEDTVRERHRQLLSVQPAPTQRYTLHFMPGGSELTPESRAELTGVLARATERPGGEIVVIGHTDRVGTVQANDALSLQRARAVRALVIGRGFPAALVRAVGRGERDPVVPTDDEVAEPRNRRAEILVR